MKENQKSATMLVRSLSIYATRICKQINSMYNYSELYVPVIAINRLLPSRYELNNQLIRHKSFKHYLDFSNVPKLDEADLEEQNVRGSGPGGQATNKTNNAVVLKHKPTGLVVKCHKTRSLWDNKKRARELMVTKLDNLLNKERSIESQVRILEEKQRAQKDYKRKKLNMLKKAFREREGLT